MGSTPRVVANEVGKDASEEENSSALMLVLVVVEAVLLALRAWLDEQNNLSQPVAEKRPSSNGEGVQREKFEAEIQECPEAPPLGPICLPGINGLRLPKAWTVWVKTLVGHEVLSATIPPTRYFQARTPETALDKKSKGPISSIWAPFGLPKGLLESPCSELSACEVGTTSEDINLFAISSGMGIRWAIGLVLGLLESPGLGLLHTRQPVNGLRGGLPAGDCLGSRLVGEVLAKAIGRCPEIIPNLSVRLLAGYPLFFCNVSSASHCSISSSLDSPSAPWILILILPSPGRRPSLQINIAQDWNLISLDYVLITCSGGATGTILYTQVFSQEKGKLIKHIVVGLHGTVLLRNAGSRNYPGVHALSSYTIFPGPLRIPTAELSVAGGRRKTSKLAEGFLTTLRPRLGTTAS
ncbi:hypothetical protein C8F04DRAFT_1180925 [Mycena alexandri]|uniref:Uncharacterized protein n=1 Tax=Mycena alexandri TaxID=1745969 RepID=A0AAD6SZH9_9AGAR|nr:hypothetical protein C8F04DRAFT_1180925 [Mycena alexandri]